MCPELARPKHGGNLFETVVLNSLRTARGQSILCRLRVAAYCPSIRCCTAKPMFHVHLGAQQIASTDYGHAKTRCAM